MDRAAEVRAWLEPRADEMAVLLEELVALDTENPPGRGLGECGRVLSDAMARLGFFAGANRGRADRRALGSSTSTGISTSFRRQDPCIVRGVIGDGRTGAVSSAAAGREDHWTRERRHERRPRRRAVDAKRGAPHPLGRAQRPHPSDRHQSCSPLRSAGCSSLARVIGNVP